MYASCLDLLLFQYEIVYLENVIVCLSHFLYKDSARVLCVYVVIACSLKRKFLCGIA
jgi:hypothetical protein